MKRTTTYVGTRVLLTCGAPSLSRIVRECLLLRNLTVTLLRGAVDSAAGDAWQACFKCSAEAWTIFLRTERCAIWLASELRANGLLDGVDNAVLLAIRDAREREMRRILTARAQLSVISAVAGELGGATIVLKGGAAVAAGSPTVDLSDLDILPPPGHAQYFAHRLEALGYRPITGVEMPYHLLPRTAPGLLDVEVHSDVPAFPDGATDAARDNAQAFATLPRLARFAPADHLWNMLVHVAVQHQERAGSVRDQLLLRAALAECSPEDIATLDMRIATSDDSMVLRDAIDFSAARQDPNHASDPYFRIAAARYAVAVAIFSSGEEPPVWFWKTLKDLALAFAVDRTQIRKYLLTLKEPAPSIAGRVWVVRHWPPAAHAALVVLRVARILGLIPSAACLAIRSRMVARSLQRRLTPPEAETSVNRRVVSETSSRRSSKPQPLQAIGATHE